MQTQTTSITQWNRVSSFYKPIDLLVTIKSFDLQAIRKRYLAARNSGQKRIGSPGRRASSPGGVAYLRLQDGKIHSCNILARLPEARGIAVSHNKIAISSESRIHILEEGSTRTLRNPWFSYIHSLDFSSDGKKLLVASSGFDCIFEYDTDSWEILSEWFAWENGFQKAINPKTGKHFYLTRNTQEADRIQRKGHEAKLIHNPENQTLPTAQRAAFINSVTYEPASTGRWLATLFHDGSVCRIDREKGGVERLMNGLTNPHGGRSITGGHLATSTAEGRIVIQAENNVRTIDVSQLPGKPSELEDQEWLQNTIVADNHLIAIDANRTAFLILDPDRQQYDMIPFEQNWAVQDMVNVNDSSLVERCFRNAELSGGQKG